MHRYLLKLGPVTIYSYGAMLALAFIAGTLLAAYRAQRQGLDKNKIIDLIFYILVSSVIGARLLYVALNWRYYSASPGEIFKIWEGGLVFYGGLIIAFAAAVWFIRRNRMPFGKTMDILAPSLALGIAIGRIGCFLNGCCWGKISYNFGIRFPFKDNPPVYAQQLSEGLIPQGALCSLPVIPAQLYESAACLIMFFFLLWLEGHKRFEGFLFWAFIALYCAFRFIIEYFRYYEANFIFGIFTASQIISMGLFITAAVILFSGTRARSGRPL